MNYNEAERWFKRYLQAHKIISVVMGCLFLTWSIIDTFTWQTFGFGSDFVNWLIWALIGVICVAAYYIRSQHVAVYRYLVVKNLEVMNNICTLESLYQEYDEEDEEDDDESDEDSEEEIEEDELEDKFE